MIAGCCHCTKCVLLVILRAIFEKAHQENKETYEGERRKRREEGEKESLYFSTRLVRTTLCDLSMLDWNRLVMCMCWRANRHRTTRKRYTGLVDEPIKRLRMTRRKYVTHEYPSDGGKTPPPRKKVQQRLQDQSLTTRVKVSKPFSSRFDQSMDETSRLPMWMSVVGNDQKRQRLADAENLVLMTCCVSLTWSLSTFVSAYLKKDDWII